MINHPALYYFHEISKITLKLVHFHFCPPSAHTYIHYMRIPQAGVPKQPE
ncbi:hypothetical protein Hanom_Chr00s001792g01687841 [Helianthus anomalus]